MDSCFLARFLGTASVMVAVAGCSLADSARVEKGGEQYEYLRNADRDGWDPDNGTIFSGENSLLAGLRSNPDENRLPVNKYLWRASLDTLSFLPLASIDTFSGVIATDWGTVAGSANERVRVTAYVRDAELTATALDVSVFRETLTPTGVWQSAAVNPAMTSRLEDAILTRARQLRIDDVDR